ncbi:MAG: hypothetical protein AAFY34_14070 [Pseudomonadota bacterium]
MSDVPKRYSLRSDGPLSATISAQGAALVGLVWSSTAETRELVLDPDMDGYDRREDSAYVGAVCGRVCGRIANGRYRRADGSVVQLARNEGDHHLHGGGDGALNRLIWAPARPGAVEDASSLRLKAISPEGAEGYPGTLEAEIIYKLDGPRLDVWMQAVCDTPCPINLTLHPYFNLARDKAAAIGNHELMVAATEICALDQALAATGEVHTIAGTGDDFRSRRKIGSHSLDTIFRLNGALPAASLTSPEGDLTLTVEAQTDALVVYDGSGLAEVLRAQGGGICLEPQDLPLAFKLPDLEHPAGQPWTSHIRYTLSEIAD